MPVIIDDWNLSNVRRAVKDYFKDKNYPDLISIDKSSVYWKKLTD